jgi:hypothetical protein
VVDINWGILQPVDVGARFQQGYQQGRQQRVQQETDKALTAYASNPDDPASVAGLARYNPALAIKIGDSQRERAAAAQKAEQEQAEKGMKVIGNAALQVALLPPEQQAAAWDQQIDMLSQAYPGVAQYKGQYSPQRLQSVLAEAGLSQQAIQNAQVKITPTQAGGSYAIQNGAGQIFDPTTNQWNTLGAPAPQAPQPMAPGQVLQGAAESSVITPEDAERIRASLGPNGDQAFAQWMQSKGVAIGKQVGGQTYYLVNGEWYDNPEGR